MAVPTLTDVKAELKITTAEHDQLLNTYLEAALRLVEARVGPATPREFTDQVATRAYAINVGKRPIQALISITPKVDNLPPVDITDLTFDANSGSIWHTGGRPLAGRWEVTYTAGWPVFPHNYHLATLITVQHHWAAQRGGSKRPDLGGVDSATLRIGQGMSRTVRRDTITLPAMAEAMLTDNPVHFGGIA